jgi:hypothetical protein
MSSKIHAFMYPLTLPLLIVLACALGPGAVLAEKADRSKPMNVEADALKYDDLKQISVFTGKVVITKGSIVIRGARVEVRQDGDGYQFGTVTSEPGRLAYYKQKREGIEYEPRCAAPRAPRGATLPKVLWQPHGGGGQGRVAGACHKGEVVGAARPQRARARPPRFT